MGKHDTFKPHELQERKAYRIEYVLGFTRFRAQGVVLSADHDAHHLMIEFLTGEGERITIPRQSIVVSQEVDSIETPDGTVYTVQKMRV